MHGAVTVIDPEFPEFPELPDVAVPVAEAEPVAPELASPEPASVVLPDVELAEPLCPPVVDPVALESPDPPVVAVTVGLSEAEPVSPELAVPSALLEPPAHPPPSLTLWGSAVAVPLSPLVLVEPLVALASPVDPLVPEVVWPAVSALPLVAVDDEVDDEFTAPLVPPAPEFPDVADGSDVASPVVVEPVEPVSPVVAVMVTVQVPE